MNNSSHARVNIIFLMVMLLTSASTMLWLFWRFPLATAFVTLTVLLGLSISTRWANWTDGDTLSDLEHGETGVQSN